MINIINTKSIYVVCAIVYTFYIDTSSLIKKMYCVFDGKLNKRMEDIF